MRFSIRLSLALMALISLSSLAYARWEVHEAAVAKMAACQMLEDPKLWDDFECMKAFKRAMR